MSIEFKPTVYVPGEEPKKVEIIDNGENFTTEKGSIPNHDKVEIVYPVVK